MNADATWRTMYGWRELRVRVCVLALAIVVSGVVSYRAAWGRRNGAQDEHVTTVHGRVLNRVTKEPIARALVTMGDEYATMTDDRGQFEMKLVQQAEQGLGVGGLGGRMAKACSPGFTIPYCSRAIRSTSASVCSCLTRC